MSQFPPAIDETMSDSIPAADALPPEPKVFRGVSYMSGNPSERQQSYGALVSIILIVGIIVIGALYVWGEDIANENGAASVLESFQETGDYTETLPPVE